MKSSNIELGKCVTQYRNEIWVDDEKEYGQVTIANTGEVSFRGAQIGSKIGRKRQFVLDLQTHPNTLTFTRQTVYDGGIGFASPNTDGCIATENMPMFSLNEGLHRPYFEQLFLSPVFKDQVKKLAPKGAAQKSIHERVLLKILIPLPSSDDQVKIANLLREKRKLVGVLGQEIKVQQTLLTKLKQAILQEAIEGKLTEEWRAENPDTEPASELLGRIKEEKERLIKEKKIRKDKALPEIAEEEIPFEIPDGWEWCRLGSIATHSLGKMLDKGKNKGQMLPYLRNANVQWFHFDLLDLKKMAFETHEIEKYSIREGDVVIVEGGYPGRAAIWKKQKPIMFQKALHRVRFFAENYSPYLFVFFLQLADMTGFLANYYTGSGIKHFTGAKLHQLVMPLPPLAEQAAIVERVESLMAMCDELESEVEQSQAYAADLLQAVLREAFAPAAS